jgi:hypothetical protein
MKVGDLVKVNMVVSDYRASRPYPVGDHRGQLGVIAECAEWVAGGFVILMNGSKVWFYFDELEFQK